MAIEKVALKLHSGTLSIPSVTAPNMLGIRVAIVLHGTDTEPSDFFNSTTYLNNLGNRLARKGYTVFAPYIVREANTLQRIRSLSERVKCISLEEDIAQGIASSIPSWHSQLVIYGISWGAEVAIKLASIMRPNVLILSGLDPDPVGTIQERFSNSKKLDPMYIPRRESLYSTLKVLEVPTILEYGDRDRNIITEILDSLHPWPDNVRVIKFKGGHEINSTDATLDSMEKLLEQKS